MTGRGAKLFPEVVVNGEHVSPQEIAAEAQNHPVAEGKPGLAWRKAASALAIRTLLLQEAARRDVRATPHRSGRRVETEEEALIRGLLEDAIVVDSSSDAQVRAEWERNPSRFRAPPLWEVSHILFRGDSGQMSGQRDIAGQAEEVAREAHASPQRFPELARQYSECSSARSGGSLGQIRPGDSVPEFEAVLKRMSAGDVTATPVASRFGWHVVRLDAMEFGRVLPFSAVRQKIADALEKAAWTRAAREFTHDLVVASDIRGIDPLSDLQAR